METVVVSTPQSSQQKKLTQIAPTTQATDTCKRQTGSLLYQIWEDEQYIFKVSSTLGTLYRCRKDSAPGEEYEKVMFKRVRHNRLENALKHQRAQKMGTVMLPNNMKYDMYQFPAQWGYMFCASNACGTHDAPIAETIYYFFEKDERRDGRPSGKME